VRETEAREGGGVGEDCGVVFGIEAGGEGVAGSGGGVVDAVDEGWDGGGGGRWCEGLLERYLEAGLES
jgi:hypothetical protein